MMKFFLIALAVSISSAVIFGTGCRLGKDLPQAEITMLYVTAADTIPQYSGNNRYITLWRDKEHGTTYAVYSTSPSAFSVHDTIIGIIRK